MRHDAHPSASLLASARTIRAHRENYIVGPNGDIITRADLPDPSSTRWVIRRKAEIVLAVRGGLLTLPEACRRYRLTPEEFFSWEAAINRHGVVGLRATQRKNHMQGNKN